MSGAIKSLIILFVLQGVLTLGVTFRDNTLAGYVADEPLLSLSLKELSKIVLSDEKDRLELSQQDGEWVLPSLQNFPVSEAKKALFDEKLFSLNRPYPVANTAIAQKQFEVSDKAFKKKITFYKDGKLVESLLLGTSPGFRKIHARLASEKQTYSVEFASYDLSLTPSSWMDKNFLKVDRSDISKIAFRDLTLSISDNKPALENLAENELLIEEEVDTLIDKLSRPTFSMVNTKIKTEQGLGTPYFNYTITLEDDTEVTYSYSKPITKKTDKEGPNYFFLKLSTAPFFFQVSKSTVEAMEKFNRSTIVKLKEEATPQEEPLEAEKTHNDGENNPTSEESTPSSRP